MENGTGADRQLKVFYDSKEDFNKLVDYIIDETYTGLPYKPTIKTPAPTIKPKKTKSNTIKTTTK
jgi:hypothetical protein